MMLNQLRLVVNDMIRRYGKPHEINIELGREVGMSAKKKTQFEKQKSQNQKANDEARQYLADKKVKNTHANILKYKLAKEQTGTMPLTRKSVFIRVLMGLRLST